MPSFSLEFPGAPRTLPLGLVSVRQTGNRALSTQEQETALGRIKESITQISTVIQSNSATSEESAAASQQLAGQAQVLKGLIGKFKFNS